MQRESTGLGVPKGSQSGFKQHTLGRASRPSVVSRRFSPAEIGSQVLGRSRPRYARSAASTPVRKIPSNVPAPPMEATGARSSFSLSRWRISAPMRVPRVPAT